MTSLATSPIRASIPVSDLARAKRFFSETLGLTVVHEFSTGIVYACGGMYFTVVPSESAGKAGYSLLTWVVADIAGEMAALRAKGIVFEDFDFPWLKTVNGLATLEGDQVAWFKDSEGNLLALAQLAG